jgi:hypothetical protein
MYNRAQSAKAAMDEFPGTLPQEVQASELSGVNASRKARGLVSAPVESQPDDPDFVGFSQRNLFGLAFSGGGIRSATFNLGVLEALEDLGLLRYVDYLSTVSGGGYIGSWYLSGRKLNLPLKQPIALDHLRRYSRYLAPQSGFFSADSWAMAMIWIRNTIMLQVTLACFLAAVLLTPRLLEQIFVAVSGRKAAAIASALVIWAVWRVTRYLAELGPKIEGRSTIFADDSWFAPMRRWLGGVRARWHTVLEPQSRIQVEIVFPLLTAGVFASVLLYRSHAAGITLPLSGLVVWVLIFFLVKHSMDQRHLNEHWRDGATLIAIACALVFMGLLSVLGSFFQSWALDTCNNQAPWHAVIWGPPMFLADCAFVIVLKIALVGRDMPDGLREWWSRLGAFLGIYSFGALAIGVFAIYGPLIVATLWGWAVMWISAGGILTTIGGFLAASGPDTGGVKRPPQVTSRIKEIVAAAAPYIFIVGLLLLVSLALHHASVWPSFTAGAATPFANQACGPQGKLAEVLTLGPHQHSPTAGQMADFHWAMLNNATYQEWWWPSLAFFIVIALTAVLAWRVDINQFSMNLFYRHRLARCYLGAARAATGERKPDLFLGFDFKDEFPFAELQPERGFTGPISIVNTSLNLQGRGNASLEERRACSFMMTPYYCGSSQTGYRWTPKFSKGNGGIRMGTAIAISGAAASPNSGFHTSAPIAFLMTFFNVRLGWWVANPRADKDLTESPRWGLWYLLKELFATADDEDHFIYLSDGGHFENLGVYELVRRRCRYIIAGDAEQDCAFTFEGLGGLIRKCRIDFQVEIEIDATPILRRADGFNGAHCAIGRIKYPEGFEGILIYLKSSLTGDEDADVLQYWKQHDDFPHESTGNQFFSESQFESYRNLGQHIATGCLGDVVSHFRAELAAGNPAILEELVTDLRQKWAPSGTAREGAFTRHAEALNHLWNELRNDRDLQFLDEQIFPGLPAVLTGPGGGGGESPSTLLPLPQDQKRFRKGFYLCQSVIQLMENVYLDLRLEENRESIDNRGWMNLFRRWAWSSMFRATYSLTSSTYGARFQTFSERHLGLTPGRVAAAAAPRSDLNFLEAQALDWLLAKLRKASPDPEPAMMLYRLSLLVEVPGSDAPAVQLPVGFAVVTGDQLRGMRIQNHLRRMGLARRARAALRAMNAYQRENIEPLDIGHEPL